MLTSWAPRQFFILMKHKLLLLLFLGVFSSLHSNAYESFEYTFEGKTLTYDVKSDRTKTCWVVRGDPSSTDAYVSGKLIIPPVVKYGDDEYTVVGIGDWAFRYCEDLTSVSIPETVTTIGRDAFSECSKLSSVNIPNYVVKIGDCAFQNCTELKKIVIPNSVTELGRNVFEASGLTEIEIPNSVTRTGDHLFSKCEKLTKVRLPNSLPSDGYDGFFYNCSSLAKVDIPNSVKEIGQKMFYNCSSLTEIILPNSVTDIGMMAFMGCSSLAKVDFSKSVTSIGITAFKNCSSLTEINIPDSVKVICEHAFEGCEKLTKVRLSNSLTTLKDNLFDGCSSLNDIIIPGSVTTIESGVFDECSSLSEIVIPNSVTSMVCDFHKCSELKKIVIGNGLEKISHPYGFTEYEDRDIYITAEIPPVFDSSSYRYLTFQGTLYVQDEDAEVRYSNDLIWGKFKSIKVMTEPESIDGGDKRIEANPGDKIQLSAKVLPEDVTLPYILWSSTDPQIATVDENGLVTVLAEDFAEDFAEEPSRAGVDGADECKIIAETLYHSGPIYEYTIVRTTSDIRNIIPDSSAPEAIDYSRPFEVYDLRGVDMGGDLERLATGIYLVRQGAVIQKILRR